MEFPKEDGLRFDANEFPLLTFIRKWQCGCNESGRVAFALHISRVEYENEGGATRQAVHLEQRPNA